MKIKVLSISFSKNEQLRNDLMKIAPDAEFNDSGIIYSGQELVECAKGYEILIVGTEKMTASVLEQCEGLKFISKYGVGLDNLDHDYCRAHNIGIGWTGGVNKTSVAEMALGFMLMLLRNLYITSNLNKNGIWQKQGGENLSGKTIGIIGLGHIGKELVRLLKPFQCKILANDIIDIGMFCKEHQITVATKEEIYRESDIITIHTPLTPETVDLIAFKEMNMMKSSAILLNTARGTIINEYDLKLALETKVIAGAGLDVYQVEPPEDKEFLNIQNLITTPHIGGNSAEAVLAMGRSAILHLKNYIEKFK